MTNDVKECPLVLCGDLQDIAENISSSFQFTLHPDSA